MARKRVNKSSSTASSASVLLVGPPSDSLARKHSLLQGSGYDITLAENICYAEVFAEAQYFDAAVYDDSLPPHEQLSLAQVMRVRWPWMRLVSCGSAPARDGLSGGIFDASESSESQLPDTLRTVLA